MDKSEKVYPISKIKKTKLGRFAVVQGEVFKNGIGYPYSYLQEKPCVCVFPLLKENVIVIQQYRYAVSDWCLELPCGAIEEGETADQAATRELQEETGCLADNLVFLGDCYARAGISDCRVYFYLAECGRIAEEMPDPTEQIKIRSIPLADFDKVVDSGEFSQLMGITCWLRAKKYLE